MIQENYKVLPKKMIPEAVHISSVINSQKGFYKRTVCFPSSELIKPKLTDLKCITGEGLSSSQQSSPSFQHQIIAIFITIKELSSSLR
jgi:hypothetical protein